MTAVSLVGGAPRGLDLEMIAATKPRLMFPSTTLQIDGLDPNAEYRIYLKLVRSSYRYQLKEQRWVSDKVPHPKEDLEEKPILNKYRQQTGEFFMRNGVSFENARISFNKIQTRRSTDTFYVRKYFKYSQQIHVDLVRPGDGNRCCKVYPIVGGEFVAVSHLESSRMSQYYAIGFENIRQFGKKRQPNYKTSHKIHPVIVMNHPSEHPSNFYGFQIEDPDDMPPTRLFDGSVVTRKHGRTYYYPPVCQ
ncbi:Protein CBG25918 [Caenorhabditis briggsae]|uniref:T-box domain-containing protein n=2 Tax=Caenorhabditis briggsae TaxID=6238 RepID=A0AAE9ELU7_CAEBR|nr:Protein CBG25918 [Caenorhabditis briggsae]ULU02136.1 hypothetical protein L3Y34_002005 [Caenorhabditis briggsae]UMM24758.1 hypothetical protein L5515_004840 [Caenorhabditis briggsae]CAR99429.1 Protein CBG25918 [Caenorhabditis briggsae]